MADKYRKIEKTQETLPPNEIRVKRKVGIGRYLKRAHDLLNEKDNAQTVIIKAVSNAVESAVKLAELIKHRVKGLHQINKITNITIDDEYEPLEEGLDHLKFTRIVTMLEIKLSVTPLDKSDLGYQSPIPEDEVQEYSERDVQPRGDGNQTRGGNPNRGRGRRGRGNRRPATADGGDRRPRQRQNNEEKVTPTPDGGPKEGEERPPRRNRNRNRGRGGRGRGNADGGEAREQNQDRGNETNQGQSRPRRQPQNYQVGDDSYGKNRNEEDKPKFEVVPGRDPDRQFRGGQGQRRALTSDGDEQRPFRGRGRYPRDQPYETREPRPPRQFKSDHPTYNQHQKERGGEPRRGGDYQGGSRGQRSDRGGNDYRGNRSYRGGQRGDRGGDAYTRRGGRGNYGSNPQNKEQ